MNTRIFFIIFQICCFSANSIFAQQSKLFTAFPKCGTVFKHYYGNYGVAEGTYVEFAKKPKGYYVITKNNSDGKIRLEDCIWSVEKRNFLKLSKSYPVVNSENKNPGGYYYSGSYNFDHSLYYNYTQAADESIAALEGLKTINDTLQEALARAFSVKCDQILGGRLGQGGDGIIGKISREKAEDFVLMGKKLIDAYKKLYKINKHYETLVGKISNKLANENMYIWFELMAAGYADLAQPFIPNNLYSEMIVNFAKNMLMSCPKNTILFTAGDNDTYPLWYVQNNLKYRQDVAVINSSLSNVPFYINYFKTANSISTTLSEEEYMDKLLSFIYIGEQLDIDPISDCDFIKLLKNPTTSINKLIVEESEYLSIPYSHLFTQVNEQYFYENIGESKQAEEQSFMFKNAYIYLSDIFELDIFATNKWQRPIGYAVGNSTALSSATKHFTENFGLVSVIGPFEPNPDTPEGSENFNATRLYNLIMNEYQYKVSNLHGYDSQGLVMNYLINFAQLANLYIAIEEKQKAAEVLEKAEKEIPFKGSKDLERMMIAFGFDWVQLDNFERGIELFNLTLTSIEEKEKLTTDNYEREDIYSLANYIFEYAKGKDLTSIVKRAEKIVKLLQPPK